MLGAAFVGVAVLVTLWGTTQSPRNGDDWAYLGYIVESQQPDANLRDPYMGTDERIVARFEFDLVIQGAILAADVFDADPVWLLQDFLPPLFALLSLGAVFVFLRAARFGWLVSACGVLLWVLYFVGSYWDFRLHGGFFFTRASQDKAVMWLVLLPLFLAPLLYISSRLSPSADSPPPRLGALWAAFAAYSVMGLVATFAHPLAFVFGAMFAAALILRSAWERWGLPEPRLALTALLGLTPALAVAAFLKYALPPQPELSFSIRDGAGDIGRADFIDIAGLNLVDPAFIAVLNFAAVAWIVVSLWRGQSTPNLRLAACLYLVVLPVYIPGVADLLAPQISAVGTWRLTWLMPFASVLALCDFVSWASAARPSEQRMASAGAAAAVIAVLALAWFHYPDFDELESSEPSRHQLELIEQVETVSSLGPARTRVLASNELSRFMSTYSPRSDLVSYPLYGTVEEVSRLGIPPARDASRLSTIESNAVLINVMEFWDAELAVLEPDAYLFEAPRSRDLGECWKGESGVVLVRWEAAPNLCPEAVQGGLQRCEGLVATIVGTDGDDILDGTSEDDVIFAGAGADRINGLAGDDVICGGEGNDILIGGADDDTLVGGEGRDQVLYAGVTRGVVVDLERGLATGAGRDTLKGIEDVTGSEGDDTLRGNNGKNRLSGGKGEDRLLGRGGNDRLEGGRGKDELNGGAGQDYCRPDLFVFEVTTACEPRRSAGQDGEPPGSTDAGLESRLD